MSPAVAVFLREQVEDGVSVFAANTVAEFEAVEAQRLIDNGVAVLAADMVAPAVAEDSAERLASLSQAYTDLQASHDALSDNATTANAEIDRLSRERVAMTADRDAIAAAVRKKGGASA